jgi:hypothetical protein
LARSACGGDVQPGRDPVRQLPLPTRQQGRRRGTNTNRSIEVSTKMLAAMQGRGSVDDHEDGLPHRASHKHKPTSVKRLHVPPPHRAASRIAATPKKLRTARLRGNGRVRRTVRREQGPRGASRISPRSPAPLTFIDSLEARLYAVDYRVGGVHLLHAGLELFSPSGSGARILRVRGCSRLPVVLGWR